MDESIRRLLVGHDSLNQASHLTQIEEAEKQQLLHYYLTFQDREGKKDLPSLSFPISSDVLRRYHAASCVLQHGTGEFEVQRLA